MSDERRFKALTASYTWRSYNFIFPSKLPRRGPVMTEPASAPFKHCEPSRYYRDRASAIRARLPTLQDDEVFNELYLLAAHYERLAEFAESSRSLASIEDWPTGGLRVRYRLQFLELTARDGSGGVLRTYSIFTPFGPER